MKRTILIALAFMVSASFLPLSAKKDKKQKAPAETAAQPTTLTTSSDTMSYAVGYAMTNGLLPYLKEQYHLDETYMDDFISGFQEAMKVADDPKQKARAAGMQVAEMVNSRMLAGATEEFKGTPDSINADIFNQGFVASLRKDTTHFNQQQAETFFKNRREAIQTAKTEANRKAGEQFLAENARKEGVKTTASGLQYKVLTEGNGPIPTSTDEVKVNYEGRLIDGTVFDSSYKRKSPANFKANQVIKGWTEALTMMPVGSKWELYIPQELGYGERGAGKDIAPYSTLIFTVELLGITTKEK